MPVFPMFIDLKGKKCIVVGAGNVAARKIETLVNFGASITVISPEVYDAIDRYFQQGKLEVLKREYMEGDLKDAFLVIAATSDKAVNERVYSEAADKNIFVNVADNLKQCTFLFPSTVVRDDLVIGISTSGALPSLSKKIGMTLESMFPANMGRFIKVFKEYRRKALVEIRDALRRKSFIDRATDEILSFDGTLNPKEFDIKIESIYGECKNEKAD